MTDKALMTTNEHNLITFDQDKIGLIKRTIAKGATDDELALFLHQAQRTGLDPLARQIHFQKYNTKNGPQIAIITGIDGYRLIADRTGKYAGSDEPVYDGRVDGKYPAKATVTVWKLVAGQRVPFSASVYWNEYYPGEQKGFQWRKMPHVMLAKCAEAAALRKAFPADLSGMYTQDELEQADWHNAPIVEGETITPDPQDYDSEDDYLVAEYAHGLGADIAPKPPETPQATTSDDEHDYLSDALNARNLSDFAAAAIHVLDGYDNVPHIVGALVNKLPEDNGGEKFIYKADKNDFYLQWLADRKQATG